MEPILQDEEPPPRPPATGENQLYRRYASLELDRWGLKGRLAFEALNVSARCVLVAVAERVRSPLKLDGT